MPDKTHRPRHLHWPLLALVFVGGLAGTAVRYGAETALPAARGEWPWATIGVNAIGSFILGLLAATLVGLGDDTGARLQARLLVGVGFCGSLTTYSAFALETDRLIADGHWLPAVGYVIATVSVGLAGAALGYLAGRRTVGLWRTGRRR
ncbi:CrcB family protein [Williamsia sp. CHRR-6]|uniref:fluoride efflux transporter FluC n=1 Tax=Williamsia sp. CHRR-6 TaxID=2835871 RepID=UPI001BD9396D|nr:CrcB family protein [Williamsia sp. CHRR-6]MBT0567200.1 CrcB family protein [Williamsia sp. CHRR-6]